MTEDSKITNELQEALEDYLVSLEWDINSYKIVLKNADKSLNVCWPYPVQESYFDFHEENEMVFHEFIEMYNGESHSEMCHYVSGDCSTVFTS
ncbi:MAG: hypothetical protein HRT89_22480 [Lentisphaeria bacterium]|nr:hypothetical protein [Lentisphaeria bacterium]NQZ70826.1 hypothetical protein [Lentisphaeria bacterium]